MPRAKRSWSKVAEVHGVGVRPYERADRGGTIYREVRLGGGGKDRASLNTADRAHAAQMARALAREVANLRNAGGVGPLTMGQLVALCTAERLPLLSHARQRTVRGMLALLAQHFRDAMPLADVTQHQRDAYAAARRASTIQSPRHRTSEPGGRARGRCRTRCSYPRRCSGGRECTASRVGPCSRRTRWLGCVRHGN